MRCRSRFDLVEDILKAASESGGATKTKIMYKAFLSHKQLTEYLQELTEMGLLQCDLDARKFKTTEKGLRFLDTYNWISDAIKAHQEHPPPPPPQQRQVQVQRGGGEGISAGGSSRRLGTGGAQQQQRPRHRDHLLAHLLEQCKERDTLELNR